MLAGVVALLVSTAAFAFVHVVAGGSISVLVGAIAVCAGCGILVLLTGRLWAAIVAHVLFNAIGVALLVW